MVATPFPANVIDSVESVLHADRDLAIHQLIRFVAIQSDSVTKNGTTRVYIKELREAAEMLAAEFQSLGCTVTFECNDTDTPIVCVSYDGAGPDAPTLGGYGHYDVQPEGKGWTVTSAFAPVVLDGYLFGRGSGDMKGPICALLHAIRSWIKVAGRSPVNFRFAFEGAEESGSDVFHQWRKTDAAKRFFRKVTAILVPDVLMAGLNPNVCWSLRGILYCFIEVLGPKKAVHSGSNSNVIQCPVEACSHIIASLRDPATGLFRIRGLNELVAPLSAGEEAIMARSPINETAILEETGAPAVLRFPGVSSLEHQVGAMTSITCHGQWGGDAGDGSPTSMFPKAGVKFSLRLPFGVEPDVAYQLLVDHINRFVRETLKDSVKVTIRKDKDGPPARIDPTAPAIGLAQKAMTAAWGRQAHVTMDGASIPLVRAFQELEPEAPVVLWGGTNANSGFHGPDEKEFLSDFTCSAEAMARFFGLLAGIE